MRSSHVSQSGDSPELAQGLPYKGKSMRNRGVSSPMPFLLIPRSLLRGGFIPGGSGQVQGARAHRAQRGLPLTWPRQDYIALFEEEAKGRIKRQPRAAASGRTL